MVFLTRNADYDLSSPNVSRRKKSDFDNRILLIKNSKCELYVSIHLNAEDNSSWSGAQVFYSNVNKENQKFAELMQNSYKENLSSKRKIKQVKTLYMYEHIKVPGLLLEVGFLSNPNERYLLKTDKYHEIGKKYMPQGTSGVISFSIKGGRNAAVKFMDSLELASNVVHVADIRTCVLHPASATHRQLTDEQLVAAGIDAGMIRLSVGLENVEDIIADLEKGFNALK